MTKKSSEPESSPSPTGRSSYFSREQGSFIVSAIFFMFVFMMIAAFSIDVTSYYNKRAKLKNMANATAFSGGQAFRQYTDYPDRSAAVEAIVNHLKQRQGSKKLEQYYKEETLTDHVEALENDVGDNIEIRHMETNCGNTNASTYYNWTSATDTETIPSHCWGSSTDEFYLVGVVLYDHFEPLFLPEASFGTRLSGMSAASVAVVEPQDNRKKNSAIDCGLIVGKGDTSTGIDLGGNNWEMGNGGMCTNADIDLSGIPEPHLPSGFPIYQLDGKDCRGGSACEERTTFGEEKGHPDFSKDDPADYDVNLGDTGSWSGANCTTSGAKAMQTSSGDSITWDSGGDPVCVKQSGGEYQITYENHNNGEQIQLDDGSPVSIYSDKDVLFDGANKAGIQGGLYAEGDITVNGNSHDFIGDKNTMDGLSLYSEGTLTIDQNNNVFEGIVGAEEDVVFNGNGGGKGTLTGQLVVGDEFEDPSNSASVDITYDESLFDKTVMTGGDWQFLQDTIEEPKFSNIEVSLAS